MAMESSSHRPMTSAEIRHQQRHFNDKYVHDHFEEEGSLLPSIAGSDYSASDRSGSHLHGHDGKDHHDNHDSHEHHGRRHTFSGENSNHQNLFLSPGHHSTGRTRPTSSASPPIDEHIYSSSHSNSHGHHHGHHGNHSNHGTPEVGNAIKDAINATSALHQLFLSSQEQHQPMHRPATSANAAATTSPSPPLLSSSTTTAGSKSISKPTSLPPLALLSTATADIYITDRPKSSRPTTTTTTVTTSMTSRASTAASQQQQQQQLNPQAKEDQYKISLLRIKYQNEIVRSTHILNSYFSRHPLDHNHMDAIGVLFYKFLKVVNRTDNTAEMVTVEIYFIDNPIVTKKLPIHDSVFEVNIIDHEQKLLGKSYFAYGDICKYLSDDIHRCREEFRDCVANKNVQDLGWYVDDRVYKNIKRRIIESFFAMHVQYMYQPSSYRCECVLLFDKLSLGDKLGEILQHLIDVGPSVPWIPDDASKEYILHHNNGNKEVHFADDVATATTNTTAIPALQFGGDKSVLIDHSASSSQSKDMSTSDDFLHRNRSDLPSISSPRDDHSNSNSNSNSNHVCPGIALRYENNFVGGHDNILPTNNTSHNAGINHSTTFGIANNSTMPISARGTSDTTPMRKFQFRIPPPQSASSTARTPQSEPSSSPNSSGHGEHADQLSLPSVSPASIRPFSHANETGYNNNSSSSSNNNNNNSVSRSLFSVNNSPSSATATSSIGIAATSSAHNSSHSTSSSSSSSSTNSKERQQQSAELPQLTLAATSLVPDTGRTTYDFENEVFFETDVDDITDDFIDYSHQNQSDAFNPTATSSATKKHTNKQSHSNSNSSHRCSNDNSSNHESDNHNKLSKYHSSLNHQRTITSKASLIADSKASQGITEGTNTLPKSNQYTTYLDHTLTSVQKRKTNTNS